MTGGILTISEWGFECALIAIMIAVIFYARRLDRSLRQIRTDRAELDTSLERAGVSIAAAIAAADRLKAEAREVMAKLDSAGHGAGHGMEQAGKLQEDLPDFVARFANVRLKERKRQIAALPVTAEMIANLKSQTERDLAKNLADVC
ncbi:MAG TPA: hypothetical protein VF286_08865 [Acidiphilium sp.]